MSSTHPTLHCSNAPLLQHSTAPSPYAFSSETKPTRAWGTGVLAAANRRGCERSDVQPENEKSKALIKRSGFRYEGFSPRYLKVGAKWCDHERWAIVAEEVKGGMGKARPEQAFSASKARKGIGGSR